MGLEDYSKHQQGIIKRYYEHQPAILVQKLGELVTDLYLAEGKKRERLWKSAATMMGKLKIPPGRIDHIVQKKDAGILAKLVAELQAK